MCLVLRYRRCKIRVTIHCGTVIVCKVSSYIRNVKTQYGYWIVSRVSSSKDFPKWIDVFMYGNACCNCRKKWGTTVNQLKNKTLFYSGFFELMLILSNSDTAAWVTLAERFPLYGKESLLSVISWEYYFVLFSNSQRKLVFVLLL